MTFLLSCMAILFYFHNAISVYNYMCMCVCEYGLICDWILSLPLVCELQKRLLIFAHPFILGFLSTKPATLILSYDALLLLCTKIKPYKVKEQTTEGEEMTNEIGT